MSDPMEFKVKKVMDLSRMELLWILQNTFNLPDVSEDMEDDELMAAFKRVAGDVSEYRAPMIPLNTPNSMASSKMVISDELSVSNKQTSKDDPVVTINIAKQEGKAGSRPVEMGVNGKNMLLPRDKDIDVPLRYVLALSDCKKTIYDRDEKTGDLEASVVLAHPFSVIRGAEHLDPETVRMAYNEKLKKMASDKARETVAA